MVSTVSLVPEQGKRFVNGKIQSLSLNLSMKEAISLFENSIWHSIRRRYVFHTGGVESSYTLKNKAQYSKKINHRCSCKVCQEDSLLHSLPNDDKGSNHLSFMQKIPPSKKLVFFPEGIPKFPKEGMTLTRYNWVRKKDEMYLNIVFHQGHKGTHHPYSTEMETYELLHFLWGKYGFRSLKIFQEIDDEKLDLSLSFPILWSEAEANDLQKFSVQPVTENFDGNEKIGIWIPASS